MGDAWKHLPTVTTQYLAIMMKWNVGMEAATWNQFSVNRSKWYLIIIRCINGVVEIMPECYHNIRYLFILTLKSWYCFTDCLDNLAPQYCKLAKQFHPCPLPLNMFNNYMQKSLNIFHLEPNPLYKSCLDPENIFSNNRNQFL